MLVISIVSAIAMPGLMRARMAGNESSAIGSIRAIQGAQSTYAVSCGSGYYSPSIPNLATPPTGSTGGFIAAPLVVNNVIKSGYRIRYRRGPVAAGSPPSCNGAAAGTLLQSYFVSADPATAAGGTRHFGANHLGTIYQSMGAVAINFNGPPPPPALPIQ